MIGVAAATLTEGDINQAAQLAKNATAYNRQLHRAEADLLQELREKDPERAEQWDAAACALVSCSKGVPPSDPNYAFLAALEAEGAKYPELQNALLDTQLFNYSFADKTSDLALRNARGAYYTAAAGSIVLGTGEAIVSGAAGGAACAPSLGAGCALAVGGIGLGMLEANEGANKIAKGYTSTQGQTVIDSFNPETHPGNWNPALEGVKFAGAVTVEAILAKVGGKLVGKVIDKVDGRAIHVSVNKSAAQDFPDNKKEKVTWVDENATMKPDARQYQDCATGARCNVVTQRQQAPSIERTLEDGSKKVVRFDGLDGDILIDRKISVVTTSKAKEQALRQSQALKENGMTARWEVPTQTQANRAEKMFRELNIENITVKVISK